MWQRKGSDHDQKHSTSSVKHGGASAMAWARMAASRNGSIRYIDDVTPDKSSRKNSGVFQAILSADILPNASELIGRCYTVHVDNGPTHTASQSPDMNLIEHLFHLLKTKLKRK